MAFGGPQAHMALLRYVVEQRLWVKAEDFEEGLASAKPCRDRLQAKWRSFWAGAAVVWLGVVSGLGFLLPPLLVVLALSALGDQQRYRGTGAISSAIQPVVAAVTPLLPRNSSSESGSAGSAGVQA